MSNSKEALSSGNPNHSDPGSFAVGDLVKFRSNDELYKTHGDAYEIEHIDNYLYFKSLPGGWLAQRFEKVAAKPEDAVNHPKHYNSDPSGIECIQVTEHRNFCIGNALKYLWRAGLKDEAGNAKKHAEDLQKAIWYIQREIERIGNLDS